ncbi:MAG: tRNA lysidine(34) synthetase TilS [Oscillospiraceae bacterium]|nr:tRNA lysidine(34) synthetase TilS [Oscillospiraceae bacterium]
MAEDGFRFGLIPPGSRVLCALSGGADSMYLLCRLMGAGVEVRAAHFNHRLRDAADREEAFVRAWCGEHGVPLTVGSGDVRAFAAEHGMGLEEAARNLRYDFLRRTAEETGCSLIATGHHAGDNAETLLMNLIRGCGLNGLCGIPEQRGNVIRPMLGLSREEILLYLERHGVPHVEDESNGDTDYTRNRIRHQVIPLLEELNPKAAAHISAAALRLRQDEALLTAQAEQLLASCEETEAEVRLSASMLARAPAPIALRSLKALLPGCGAVHLEQVLALCSRPSGQLDVPGCTVSRAHDLLVITRAPLPVPPPAPLSAGEQRWGMWRILYLEDTCPAKAYRSVSEFWLAADTYMIRPRQEGDRIQLGHRPAKTVKKWMIEQRIPRHLRSQAPVIARPDGQPAAVGGLGPHWEALAKPGTRCLHIVMEKEESSSCIRTSRAFCSAKRP